MFSRQLTVGAAAVLLSPRTAAAETKDERDRFPSFGYLRLHIGPQILVPTRIIVIGTGFNREIGINLLLPLENENRASLINPPLARRFKDAVPIGDAFLVGKSIIVNASVPVQAGDLRVSDGSISFRVNSKKLGRPLDGPVPVLGGVPMIGQLFRRRDDTKLKRNLLVKLTPGILDYTE
jgi:hypothetical protein